ncbi:Decaprenyl-diphosphate synthase subunit 2 [Bulinus truncatus]|nr:Decaprenyl-diphosphate synthase subunit 2 [Bulinus truncatus]
MELLVLPLTRIVSGACVSKTFRKAWSLMGKNNLQLRGLFVMLISKAAGPNPQAPYTEQEMISGVYPSQRALAEITEVIYTASLIHKGIVNLKDILPDDGPCTDMEFGNKMAVLSGDYLLSTACSGLAKLGNPLVVEMVARAIGDIMTAEFTNLTGAEGKQGVSGLCLRFTDWLKQTRLSLGSLLANSCQSAMTLAGHSNHIEEMAYSFGENATYAQQLSKDINMFKNQDDQTSMSSLAPVILSRELSSEGEIDYLTSYSQENVSSYNKLFSLVCGSGALEQCQDLCLQYRNKAIASLEGFKESDTKMALVNMVTAVSSIK